MERKNSAELKDKRRLFSLFAAEQNELRALFQECQGIIDVQGGKGFSSLLCLPSPHLFPTQQSGEEKKIFPKHPDSQLPC